MKALKSIASQVLLNAALVLLGLALLVLLYALGTRIFLPRTDAARESTTTGLVGEIIQVEVRNGCGEPGLAGEVTRYLRRHGFDVVASGNQPRFDQDSSVVLDRVGDLPSARKIAEALGIAPARVRQELRPDLYLDASVIIGKDYETLAPFKE